MRRLLVAILSLVPAALGAQGRIIPRPCPMPTPRDPRVEISPVRCPPASAVVRTRSDVRVELVDRVLRYEIEERFVNRGSLIGEADYLFPLPKGAAFQDLKLSIDGEMVAGETLGAAEARRIYEEIVRRQRDPALVEWMGRGLLRTRIFPIQPGEERRIIVRLQAVAEREGDALRVDWSGGSASVDASARPFHWGAPPENQGTVRDDDERNRSDARTTNSPRASFVLTYDLADGLGAAYSPTHELSARTRGGRRVVEARGAARDVTILVPLRRAGAAAVSVLAHAPGGEDGFALVTLAPPAVRGESSPRDVTFVLDVSGSMSGAKMTQARAAGRQLLATLRPEDRFRVVDFATDVRTFRDDFVPATRENLRAAERYLDDLDPGGSTNIAGALEEALRGETVPGRLPVVLFLTDGEPTVGQRDPEAIAAAVARRRGARRLFTFGVGADLNAALLERLALEGRGTAHFVRPGESVERAVALAAQRLVDPIITDLRVRAEGEPRLSKAQPQGAIDLFAGQDLVLLTRVRGSGRARLVFEGTSRGRPVRWSHDVIFPERERGNAFVARLWATQRVGWLSAERRRGAGNDELDAEIRELGERFGIPTEFTSYFVREPGMVAGRLDQPRPQDARGLPAPPPASVSVRGRATQLEELAVTGATGNAPARQEQAFERARKASEQRAATSVAAADAVAAPGARHAGGHAFVQDPTGRWTDTRPVESRRVVRVKPYAAAWFALAEALPELREAFALGERVLVVGRGVAVESAPDGAETLPDDALRDILRQWK